MGMYTSVIIGKDSELQFKSDVDDCETYRVGDAVNWKIWPDQPGIGKLLDGVYDAVLVGNKTEIQYSVVIDNHRIIYAGQADVFVNTEKIVPYERGWWSESVWLKKDQEDAKQRLRIAKEEVESLKKEIAFLSSLEGLDDSEIADKRKKFYNTRLQDALVSGLIEITSRPSLTRQLLTVTPAKSKKTHTRSRNKKTRSRNKKRR